MHIYDTTQYNTKREIHVAGTTSLDKTRQKCETSIGIYTAISSTRHWSPDRTWQMTEVLQLYPLDTGRLTEHDRW